jgi:hypothetical protein
MRSALDQLDWPSQSKVTRISAGGPAIGAHRQLRTLETTTFGWALVTTRSSLDV